MNRIAVVTVVHDPRDARIYRRQIVALTAAGYEVTFAAPFTAFGVVPPSSVRAVDLPRASGRNRLRAIRTARTFLHQHGPNHDLVLLHDPELLMAVGNLSGPCVVWDVHEDTASAVSMKAWIPDPLKSPARRLVSLAESRAEDQLHLILAEEGYRARFKRHHPVVPNTTPVAETVAPPGDSRIVYVGSLTRERGVKDMVDTARLLADENIQFDLVGPADTFATSILEPAHRDGIVTWHGFVPNEAAMNLLDGALCGLSLLHDEPNYQHSRPSKVLEYMAHGIPVVSTPTAAAAELLESTGAGVLVPYVDPDATAEAIRQLHRNRSDRESMGRRGHTWALRNANWNVDSEKFIRTLESWLAGKSDR